MIAERQPAGQPPAKTEECGPEELQQLVLEHCLTHREAEALLRSGITPEAWAMREPAAAAVAYRAQRLVESYPWLDGRKARQLVDRHERDDALLTALGARTRQRTGLSPSALATYIKTGEILAERPSDEAFTTALRERAEQLARDYPDLDAMTRIRVAFGDGQLTWPPDTTDEKLASRAGEVRRDIPVIDKPTALRMARFDMSLEHLAALRPKLHSFLPKALELMRAFPSLHRKTARTLARQGASDDAVRAFVDASAVGGDMWCELASAGPLVFVTYEGLLEGELDPSYRNPYLFRLADGRHLLKLEVLLAFPETHRGAALGRMKRVADIEALELKPRDVRKPLPPRELLARALREELPTRLTLRNGRAFTARVKRQSRFEYQLELKGGVQAIALRHGLAEVDVIESGPKPAAAGADNGGKRGRKKRGRKKGK